MNIAASSNAIHNLALRLISQEVMATLGVYNSSGTAASRFLEEARGARNKLLPLLRATAALRDIDLILLIERRFLTLELECLAEMPRKISSLNLALSQLGATMNLLRAIRETTTYQYAGLFFTLEKNRVHGMPRDEAQQFFSSHAKRLDDLGTGRWEGTEAELINGRISNIKVAQKEYTKLQRRALMPSEAREEPVSYLVA